MSENHAPAGGVTCNDIIIPPSTYKGSFSRIKGIHSVKDCCSPAFLPLHWCPLYGLQFILSHFLNKLHETQSLLNWSHRDQESTLPLGNPKIAHYISQSCVIRPQFTPSYAFSRYLFLFVFVILSLSSNCLLLYFVIHPCFFLLSIFHPLSLLAFFFLPRLVFISFCIFLFRSFRVLSENAY